MPMTASVKATSGAPNIKYVSTAQKLNAQNSTVHAKRSGLKMIVIVITIRNIRRTASIIYICILDLLFVSKVHRELALSACSVKDVSADRVTDAHQQEQDDDFNGQDAETCLDEKSYTDKKCSQGVTYTGNMTACVEVWKAVISEHGCETAEYAAEQTDGGKNITNC